MSFGTNLQFLRDRADMTQEALAEALQVSRQSVSKWESDASFPEMDKLLVLCRLFHTDLDTLVRGDVKEHFRTDAWGYDRHMNWFSNAVAAAMALLFLSVGGALGLYSLGALSRQGLAAVLISGVALAVAILVVAGIRHSTFEQAHPVIQDFYTGAQRERFLAIYPFLFLKERDGFRAATGKIENYVDQCRKKPAGQTGVCGLWKKVWISGKAAGKAGKRRCGNIGG